MMPLDSLSQGPFPLTSVSPWLKSVIDDRKIKGSGLPSPTYLNDTQIYPQVFLGGIWAGNGVEYWKTLALSVPRVPSQ